MISLFSFNFIFLIILFFLCVIFLNIKNYYYSWFYNLYFLFTKKNKVFYDLPNYEKFYFSHQISLKNYNIVGYLKYYVKSFFSGAWYLDITITRFAFYICFSSLYIFYYIIDKGIIYLFGPEGWVSLFLVLSRKLAKIQAGITSFYIFIMILSIFLILSIILF